LKASYGYDDMYADLESEANQAIAEVEQQANDAAADI
jgi:hypothetical protein